MWNGYVQGDVLQRWRTEPFIMITGSGRWIPPPLPTGKNLDADKDVGKTYAAGRNKRVEVERTLTDPQRDDLEDMLRALTLERIQIKEAMAFALDNADAAGEIVEVLTESLTLKETPIPTKVARLMLVSDILHNSSAPVKNASAYRTKFEATLPDIIESFNDLYRSVTGRMTAEALKERVLKVLQVWSDWFLFSEAYINGLRVTFLRPSNSGVTPFHSICGDAPEAEIKTLSEFSGDGSKINPDYSLAMGKGAAMKELLDLPLAELARRCRHNGLSLVGGREMMVARLLSLEEAEKLRGSELDATLKYMPAQSGTRHSSSIRDVDEPAEPLGSSVWNQYGEEKMNSRAPLSVLLASSLQIPTPELAAFSKKRKSESVLPVSKWTREDDGSDDEQKRNNKGLGLSYSSGSEGADDGPNKADEIASAAETSTPQPGNRISEEQRQKLRSLEVALMEYRESLEDRGVKDTEEIERKVDTHKKRLELEYGLSSATDDPSNRKPAGERRNIPEDSTHSSRKRHRGGSRSHSPPPKISGRDRDRKNTNSHENPDRDRHHESSRDRDRYRDRTHDTPSSHGGRSGWSSRERDSHDRGRDRRR
uniref:CID domain-containing protein n=1 Tax=Kalanchoe fedtschenkoi TaxID=63787 RepID=A0A7N0URI8_KALFE